MSSTRADLQRMIEGVRATLPGDLLAPLYTAQAVPTPPPGAIAALIDHTLLKPEASKEQIARLCQEAKEYGFYSVCVNPSYAALCSRLLHGTAVKVCCVNGFPLGATLSSAKAGEAKETIAQGVQEIDMVINVGALKSGDYALVKQDIAAVVAACRQGHALCKVIIEAALLTDEEKVAACLLAKAAGTEYVKTSTGFGPGGATEADVALMRATVGPALGVKAAGGIRDLATLRRMVEAGATRIGASAGVKIVQEAA